MFEKRLKEISRKLGEESTKEFYILTHKKHRREIYFQNNKKSKGFIKNKLNSPLKMIVYFLIRTRVLQPFLKKIKLSSKLGDVIYVANQIKSFDLKNKEVTSFIKEDSNKKIFLELKKIHRKISKKGFAPEMVEINEEFPYSKEELLQQYGGEDDLRVFKRLMDYYKKTEIKEVSLEKYLFNFKKRLKRLNKKNYEFLDKTLRKIEGQYSKKTKLKLVRPHGSFAKEQVLVKGNSYVFTDFGPQEEGLIIKDLADYFKKETDLLNNKRFKRILGIYPKDVRDNIKLYLLLEGINSEIKEKLILGIS
ncbi:MAG: hypothetical protein WDZ69_03590 [Candidatus Pacearchaeota archaeon]